MKEIELLLDFMLNTKFALWFSYFLIVFPLSIPLFPEFIREKLRFYFLKKQNIPYNPVRNSSIIYRTIYEKHNLAVLQNMLYPILLSFIVAIYSLDEITANYLLGVYSSLGMFICIFNIDPFLKTYKRIKKFENFYNACFISGKLNYKNFLVKHCLPFVIIFLIEIFLFYNYISGTNNLYWLLSCVMIYFLIGLQTFSISLTEYIIPKTSVDKQQA